MGRGVKVLIVVLIILVGALAGASGFFYAKSVSLEKKSGGQAPTTKNNDNSTNSTTTPSSNQTSSTSTSSVTQPAAAGNRPSAPADTYTVGSGDTLSIIGSKVDVSWITLADANGLSTEDANKIKVGQVLIVPKNNQIAYNVDSAKAQDLQSQADSGKISFRLSAADTAKSDAPPCYGLAVTDTFTQKTVDTTTGTATVTGTHNGKNYEIKLTQPATKGDKGIWAIVSIKLTNQQESNG